MSISPPQGATASGDLLERAGLRRTRAGVAVLDVLRAEPARTLNHAELESALRRRDVSVNRVTLYRLLERLVGAGLLEKHRDEADRAWRFGMCCTEPGLSPPRFACDACHRHFNLPEASEPTRVAADQILAALSSLGHMGQRVDLSIRGTCSGCIETAPRR